MSKMSDRTSSRRQVVNALGLTALSFALPVCRGGAQAQPATPAAGGQGPGAANDWTGERMFKAVQAYSAMGNHRVGTPVDAMTNRWFADQLRAMGGRVEMQRFTFDRFEGSSAVSIDGQAISSMPLYYEAAGEVRSDSPRVAAMKVTTGDRASQALKDELRKAKAAGAAMLVIATEGAGGELSTPNCFPVLGSGVPTILVPGRYADALRTGKVVARVAGRIVPGESSNVVARFGDQAGTPVLIATPLSGWFTCAAERGTGIAVALALADRFRRDRPVLVVGSPGHELLHHIGLEAYLKANRVVADLILHLGANVAVGLRDETSGRVKLAPGFADPGAVPEAGRAVFVRMATSRFSSIEAALANADLPAVLNPPSWNGEGALWAEAASGDLLSFTGIHPLFHTSGDVPQATTSPAALATVYQAIAQAVANYMA